MTKTYSKNLRPQKSKLKNNQSISNPFLTSKTKTLSKKGYRYRWKLEIFLFYPNRKKYQKNRRTIFSVFLAKTKFFLILKQPIILLNKLLATSFHTSQAWPNRSLLFFLIEIANLGFKVMKILYTKASWRLAFCNLTVINSITLSQWVEIDRFLCLFVELQQP